MENKRKSIQINNKKVATAIVVAVVTFVTLLLLIAVKTRLILPSFVTWKEKEIYSEEMGAKVVLKDKKVKVDFANGEDWESPNKFKISDVMLYDIDHDGEDEMLMLALKRGKYGKDRPSWVKRDEICWSQHVYLYEISDKRVAPKWMASDIGFDVTGWACKNGYLILGDAEGKLTYWEWNNWGLEKVLSEVDFNKWNDR